jgi:hypothetical protein
MSVFGQAPLLVSSASRCLAIVTTITHYTHVTHLVGVQADDRHHPALDGVRGRLHALAAQLDELEAVLKGHGALVGGVGWGGVGWGGGMGGVRGCGRLEAPLGAPLSNPLLPTHAPSSPRQIHTPNRHTCISLTGEAEGGVLPKREPAGDVDGVQHRLPLGRADLLDRRQRGDVDRGLRDGGGVELLLGALDADLLVLFGFGGLGVVVRGVVG